MRIITKCINQNTPSFSWILEDTPDKHQAAYHITVYDLSEHVIWSSGTVNSSNSTQIPYEGTSLSENTKYLWKVTITTENAQYTSDTSSFITPLRDFSNLLWVSAPSFIDSPFIHREFHLQHVHSYSILNISGLGYFEVYINGKKVSDELMNPARTDYTDVEYRNLMYPYTGITRKSIKFLSYEISDYLKTGTNIISVWLGNGWYRQTARTVEGTFYYGNQLKMFFQLINGPETIKSDNHCYCTESPILYNNIFYGEIYDARKDCTTRYPVIIDTAPTGSLSLQLCPPERVRKTYTPVLIKEIDKGQTLEKIYDSQICLTGFAEITCTGNYGDEVYISYAEEINEFGDLDYQSTVGYVESDKQQIQMDKYILCGNGRETYIPHFVWHAFRYFKITPSDSVTVENVKTHYVCTDMPLRTKFDSSSQILNQIHHISLNTQLSNTHGSIPLDCPHRERLGYTGDGQLSSLSVMSNFDAHEVYAKWATDILDSQDMESGFVPHTAPFSGGGGGPGWGSAIAIVPWNLYYQYGDLKTLQKARPHIRKWLEYLNTCRENGFVVHEQPGDNWCLGDWCMPSKYPWSDPFLHDIRIPPALVNTVYFIICTDIYHKISILLGLETESWILTERSISADAVNTLLLDNNYAGGEQGSNLFPLYAGIVPQEQEYKVLNKTIERIIANNYRFDTGLSGTCFAFHVLDKYSRNDIAMKMMLCTEYPGFGNMIKNGATALWETWEGNGSRNHTAFSSADAWLFYGLAGIKPLGGYKEFTLKPYFAPELTHLNISITCEYGEIILNWKRISKCVHVEIKIPFNTTAHVNLNGKCFDAEAGSYHIVLQV